MRASTRTHTHTHTCQMLSSCTPLNRRVTRNQNILPTLVAAQRIAYNAALSQSVLPWWWCGHALLAKIYPIHSIFHFATKRYLQLYCSFCHFSYLLPRQHRLNECSFGLWQPRRMSCSVAMLSFKPTGCRRPSHQSSQLDSLQGCQQCGWMPTMMLVVCMSKKMLMLLHFAFDFFVFIFIYCIFCLIVLFLQHFNLTLLQKVANMIGFVLHSGIAIFGANCRK